MNILGTQIETETFGFSHEKNVQPKVAVRFWNLKIWRGRRLDFKTLLLKGGREKKCCFLCSVANCTNITGRTFTVQPAVVFRAAADGY